MKIVSSFNNSIKVIDKYELSVIALRAAILKCIKESMSEELFKHITYFSMNKNRLFIVFDHPASFSLYGIEEKYFLDKIKNYFKTLQDKSPKDYWIKIQEILNHELKIFSKPTPIYNCSIQENAEGNFKNHCANEKIKVIFEEIRDAIKYNHKKDYWVKKGFPPIESVVYSSFKI